MLCIIKGRKDGALANHGGREMKIREAKARRERGKDRRNNG